jgi:hypothetical protein
MSLPIILAKSLLSLTLLSAAAPAGGGIADATTGAGETGGLSAENVQVTRTAATYDGTQVTPLDLAVIPDPLELAKTYAPETVEEWTRTLEQYKEKGKFLAYSVHVTPPAEGGKEGDATTLPVEIAVRAIPALRVDAETEAVPDEAAPKPVSVDIRRAVVVEDAALEGIELNAVSPVVKVFPLDEGIVKAQTAVAKALEAGGNGEIRTALHDLLTAYQAFLAEK